MTTRIGILLAVLSLASGRALGADSKTPDARLAHAVGDVTIESKEGGRLGKTGSTLANGNTVTTAAGALAVIEMPDGSRLKLRESSRVAVTWPGPKNGDLAEAFLSYGSIFAKVTKRLAGQKFNVRTPNAVAAVRGTEFFTAYGRAKGKKRDLWVCVNEGSIELSTTKSKRQLVVPAGKGVLIKSGVDLTEPQAFDWTKTLNWNMEAEKGELEDKTNLDAAYSDLLDQDYR